MFPFQERKKLRKILYAKATLFALFVVLVLVARGAWQIHQKAVIARAERDEAARSLSDIQGRTNELTESLTKLKSDRGREEEIRQKFTVATPGEEVVVVVDENAKKGKNSEASEQSLWSRILGFFGI